MSIRQAARRLAIEGRDHLISRPWFRGLVARYWAARTGDPPAGDPRLPGAVGRLCQAARLTTNDRHRRRLEARIAALLPKVDPATLGAYDRPGADPALTKTAVLKPWVGPREKGVVYCAFPYNWPRLVRSPDVKGFADRYTLVIATSFSPPHDAALYSLVAGYPGEVFSTISNPRDPEWLGRISPKFRPLDLYASSWVLPELYRPRPPAERDIDLLMIAQFGTVKRHHALFRALRTMPRDLKVTIIGQHQDGRTEKDILRDAAAFGVADRFELLANQAYTAVADALCRSKASVVLSRREGSCVAIAESLFADTPAALYEDAAIGSKVFLNERTGRLLKHRDLGRQLTEFVAESGKYSPRAWAVEHISCYRSTERLNAALKEHALAAGGEWTRDIVPMARVPNAVALADPAAGSELARERDLIAERHGVRIAPPPPLPVDLPAPQPL